jgi:lipid II:glycine glycyltransferase (peptidoglycan interpeptide bridge formation enzyme)
MKESLRKNIRQAEGEITITNSPEHLKDLYDFYRHMLTRKRKSAHFTLSYMQRLLDACIEHDAGALWVAKSEGTIHGIVWQVWDSECSYALSLGQNPGSDNYKAMSLLLWHCIKEGKNRGQKTFDLEGSMDPGVERFYRSFGGKRALYLILSKNTSRIWKLKQLLRG